MRGSTIVLLALGCILWVGAEAGSQPGDKKKPPFGVGPTPARVRWEYRVETAHHLFVMGKDRGLEGGLNMLGAEGWELTGIDSGAGSTKPARESMYVLRRPLTGPAKADPKAAPDRVPKEKVEDKLELRTYVLRHALAADMARLVADVLTGITEHKFRIAPEPVTNQVVVNGSIEVHQMVQALLERLDIPAENEKPKAPRKKS